MFQVASRISEQTLKIVGEVFIEGFKILFNEAQQRLKKSIELMDHRAREKASGSASKFATFKMSCGSIENFHEGLGARVGDISIKK